MCSIVQPGWFCIQLFCLSGYSALSCASFPHNISKEKVSVSKNLLCRLKPTTCWCVSQYFLIVVKPHTHTYICV